MILRLGKYFLFYISLWFTAGIIIGAVEAWPR